ncbi:MAG: hypothetical protein F4Z36_05845 [Acidimicrobiia bacterium]|nr:hypothetical protein [bacterium]MXX64583.1 hypothetical protein [Acidimicrobiia bacterium]MCY3651804.1 hypothetical protein [bacterium]MDE0642749.1 hypothetical protein [bacterium]MYD04875.1 hypothetical protein [Acidimicrobiia bacterium]
MKDKNTEPQSDSIEEKTTRYAELGDLLRSSFEDEKAGAELREAWIAFVEAGRDLGAALAATAGDPEVRANLKNATRSLVETVGNIAKEAAETAAERVRTVTNQTKDGSERAAGQTEPTSESSETAADNGEGGAEKADSSASK